MATDTTEAPDKKLTGAALAKPDGQAPTREGELAAEFQAAREDDTAELLKLADGMEALGYPASSGPEDATIVDKALFALRGMQSDREELRAQLTAAEKKAKAKPGISKGEAPATPRKLGPVENTMTRDGLRAAIEDADKVEVAFSDGKREIGGLAPVVVDGAWREHSRGLLLDGEVTIDGPSTGSSVAIAGYVLLLDGKPVAYAERSDPLAVAPGQKVGLVGDIIF